MNKPTHTVDGDRFHDAMKRLGWQLDKYGTWIIPTGNTRAQSEKQWTEALLESISCPYEDAGTDKH